MSSPNLFVRVVILGEERVNNDEERSSDVLGQLICAAKALAAQLFLSQYSFKKDDTLLSKV